MFSRRFLAVSAASAVVAVGMLGAVLAASPPVPTVGPMQPASGPQAVPAPHAVPGPIPAQPRPLADAVSSGRTPDCRYPEVLLICLGASDNGD